MEPWRVILIAMGLTLLIEPMNLVNLGWLLSFGSFIGILILAPIMTRFFYGDEKPKLVSELIITTLSATIATAPILLYFFGSLSLISVLANLLILPTIPLAMGLTFLTGIFKLFSIPTNLLLKYHLFVMKLFATKTMFLVQIPKNNLLVFLIYVPVVSLVVLAGVKQKRSARKKKKPEPLYFKT